MLIKIKTLTKKILYISKLTNVKNKKARILLSVFLANASVLLDILIIVTFASILNNKVSYENKFVVEVLEFIISTKTILPVLVFLRFLFLFLEKLNIEKLSLDVLVNLKSYLMKETFLKGNLSTSDAYFFINQVAGHVSFFYRSFATFVNSLTQIIGYSLFLLFSEANVFIIFIFGGLILALPTKYFLKKGKHYQHIVFNASRSVDGMIQRILDNSFLIKILKTIEYEKNEFRNKLKDYSNNQVNNVIFGSINSIVPTFTTLFILSVLFTYTSFVKIITFEFIGVLLRLFQSLSGLNNGLNLVVNSSVHVEELYKLDTDSPNLNLDSFVSNKNLEPSVKFSNVSFRYFNSEDYIFTDLNLEIPNNKHTIITGPNGSGKSTLLGLISGLYIPTSGLVEIKTNKLGYVGVTPLIIDSTIKENLLYGNNKNVSDEKIVDLLKRFNFYTENKKIDLSKKISNKTLSSGQMQKVSFIRSLLSEVEILLLDEATSNLDTVSKKLIFDILQEEKITIINSTHNKSEFDYDFELKINISEDNSRYLELV